MQTTLMRIRQTHHLTSRLGADQAGLPLRIEHVAERGGLVEKEDTNTIATALASLAGKPYTLAVLGLVLKREENR